VILEAVGAARFGLDAAASDGPPAWVNLSWDAVSADPYLRLAPPPSGTWPSKPRWAGGAAAMAAITERPAGPSGPSPRRAGALMVRPTDHAIPPDEVAPATAATAAPPLADGAAPAILLPVRLETRWFEVGSPTELELRVRIFPDELHVPADDHDAPTAHERALAIAWWQARDTAPDGDAVAAAWQALVTAARPGRAALADPHLRAARDHPDPAA
jgi:hypothetical protein